MSAKKSSLVEQLANSEASDTESVSINRVCASRNMLHVCEDSVAEVLLWSLRQPYPEQRRHN